MPSAKKSIEQILNTLIPSLNFEVIDESENHIGHAGNPGGGESHFCISITNQAISAKERIALHKLISREMKTVYDRGVHSIRVVFNLNHTQKNSPLV